MAPDCWRMPINWRKYCARACWPAPVSASNCHARMRRRAHSGWGLHGAVERGERRLFAVRAGDGRIDGTLQLALAGMPNSRHRAELSKMLVHPRARRQGMAQALILHAEAAARSLGRTLLVLDTCTGEPAERMYLKLGYERCGEIPQFATMPDGRLGATTFMYKLL